MTSEKCRAIKCPYFYKFSGKAACQFTRPKKFVKHMQDCPAIIKKKCMKTLQNNFTTPEQSKRLLELGVPAWTADFYFDMYEVEIDKHPYPYFIPRNRTFANYSIDFYIPCWSVGRLIEIYDLCINCMPGMDLQLHGNDYVEKIIAAFKLACDDSLEDFSKLED